MYNHARTLLMNVDGSDRHFANYPGDELVPGVFRNLQLPTYLDTVRMRLFGALPDRMMLNYRVAQLLRMIEATELQEHILELDSRLTYNNDSQQLFLDETFQPQVNRYRGSSSDILTLIGQAIAPDSSGRSRYEYRVTIDGTNILIERLTPPTSILEEAITLTDGLSQVLPLPFSGYKIRVNTTTPGAAWLVNGYLRPQVSMSALEKGLRSIGEPYLLQLFGSSPEEPYLTFRNCWRDHPEFAYRLGGLVLALIYRTEELRNA